MLLMIIINDQWHFILYIYKTLCYNVILKICAINISVIVSFYILKKYLTILEITEKFKYLNLLQGFLCLPNLWSKFC